MRVLITGFVIFVIWCFISAWLYNDKILPAMQKPVTVPATPESLTSATDSLMKIKASMPGDLVIYFEFNDAKFKADPQTDQSANEIKEWLDKYQGSILTVTGYTDLVGTAEYNNILGLKRASEVKKYLEAKGIDSSRIITESLGKRNPASDYLTREGRAKNRRTEISIKMQ